MPRVDPQPHGHVHGLVEFGKRRFDRQFDGVGNAQVRGGPDLLFGIAVFFFPGLASSL
jgi:hypothetical protein